MKSKTKMFATTLVALLLGAGGALNLQAQPDLNNAPKGGNPPNRDKQAKAKLKAANRVQAEGKAKAAREARMNQIAEAEAKRIEALAGKPLSDEQKQQLKEAMTARLNALRAAQDAYLGEVAKLSGLTPDELRLKMRGNALQKGERGERRERRKLKGERDVAAAN